LVVIETSTPPVIRKREVFPWKDMEVGHWFVCPPESRGSIRPAASRAGKHLGRRFSVGKTEKGLIVKREA
jgi:hypothetical protein